MSDEVDSSLLGERPEQSLVADAQGEGGHSGTAEVDLERLAEKVYRLMSEEIRLARARGQACDERR